MAATPIRSTSTSFRARTNQGFPEGYFLQTAKVVSFGGFSKVFKVKDTHSGQDVIIKEQHVSQILLPCRLNIYTAEVEALQHLGAHPNIITMYGHWRIDDHVFLSMTYARGGDLLTYTQNKGALTEWEAQHVFRQIATALNFAHLQGFCHRDIKVDNIFLLNPPSPGSPPSIVVGDWGFSCRCSPFSQLKDFLGTPEYNSPEIHGKKAYFGPEVDVWALAVTLWVLLTGAFPFGSDAATLHSKVVTVDSDSGTPAHIITQLEYVRWRSSLADLIIQMFRVSPKRRISCNDILKHPWVTTQIVAREPPRAKPSASVFAQSISRVYRLLPKIRRKNGTPPPNQERLPPATSLARPFSDDTESSSSDSYETDSSALDDDRNTSDSSWTTSLPSKLQVSSSTGSLNLSDSSSSDFDNYCLDD